MADPLRVGLLADTHGVLDPRVAAEIEACDIAVHAGDVGKAAVLDALRPRRGEVVVVYGNNDMPSRWPRADRKRLAALPESAGIVLPGGTLSVVHGDRWPARRRHARLRREFPGARAVVYGHSHRLTLDKDERPWVLNPGAAGRSRTYGGPSCLILTARPDRWSVRIRQFSRR